MIDGEGVEWLPVEQAARVVRVRVQTIRVWVHRGKVQRLADHVRMPDVMNAEHAWRERLAARTTRV